MMRNIGEIRATIALRLHRWVRSDILYDALSALVWGLILVSVICLCLFRQVLVEGDSMNDTLFDGDRLLVTSIVKYKPSYGDIVVVNRYAEAPLIKRIIAMEGDSVYIDPTDRTLYINGKAVNEEYVHYPNKLYNLTEEVVVPEGCVFVMGDHRNDSLDSRSEFVSFVDIRDIVGKAVWRIYPLSSFGYVE